MYIILYMIINLIYIFYLLSFFIYFYHFSKRPYCEECHEHRWLISSDYMIKKRERAVFLGNRLKVCTHNSIDVFDGSV